jgi:ribonucleotide reductase beta subunit family protein with ferritin-like domain
MSDDPILKEDLARYVMFPIQDNEIWKMYKKQVDCFWRAEEIDLSKDLNDWEKLSEEEKHYISMVLAFFAASDGIVMENLATRFIADVQLSEARAFYTFQAAMETIHSEMYSILIETYIKDKVKKDKLFSSIENYASIGKKAEWARKWIGHDLNDKSPETFATRLIAFACVEGIFFSSSFAAIFWLKKRGIMPGLTLSNEFISRDEALHTEFAILLYSKLKVKLPKSRILEIVREAVEIEKEFVLECVGFGVAGLGVREMLVYVEYVGDRILLQTGQEKNWGVSNPLEFMEMISLESKSNFFERTVSEYAMANKSVSSSVFELTCEF